MNLGYSYPPTGARMIDTDPTIWPEISAYLKYISHEREVLIANAIDKFRVVKRKNKI